MRPVVPIPETPTRPYPILISNTEVVPGFGRGSTEMGIPTANVPVDSQVSVLDTGVYFGWAKLHKPSSSKPAKTVDRIDGKSQVTLNYGEGLSEADFQVLPMVMSLGWNPYFKNSEKACELHIMHTFKDGFYGAQISFNVLGYIRPELDYTTMDALIEDINIDVATAKEYLAKPGYLAYQKDLE